MTDEVGEFTTTTRDQGVNGGHHSESYFGHTLFDRAASGTYQDATAPDRLVVAVDDAAVVVDGAAPTDWAVDTDASASPVQRAARRTRLHELAKRVFDVAFATTMLVVTLPVFLLIVLAIRVSSPGPAFFRQQRRGRYGAPFRCWKFRTMYVDADEQLSTMLEADPRLRDEFETAYKLQEDPRVTPVGRVLRRTSLDELPQLLNVLGGQMSVVGPRPIVDDEVPKYGRSMAAVESVRPGMTGLWQVSGRNDLPYDVRVQLDEHYSTTQSLWFDLKILFRTVAAVVRGQGAY